MLSVRRDEIRCLGLHSNPAHEGKIVDASWVDDVVESADYVSQHTKLVAKQHRDHILLVKDGNGTCKAA